MHLHTYTVDTKSFPSSGVVICLPFICLSIGEATLPETPRGQGPTSPNGLEQAGRWLSGQGRPHEQSMHIYSTISPCCRASYHRAKGSCTNIYIPCTCTSRWESVCIRELIDRYMMYKRSNEETSNSFFYGGKTSRRAWFSHVLNWQWKRFTCPGDATWMRHEWNVPKDDSSASFHVE